jgi:hypothetical protein
MDVFKEDRPADEQRADAFISALKAALRELQVAYPSLLNMIERALIAAFGLSKEAFRDELATRSKRLLPVAVETQIRGFLVRSSDDSLDREGYLVSLATVLVGKPPENWHDRDFDQLRVAAALIARKFHILESLTIDGIPNGNPGETHLLRLSVAQTGVAERESVVVIREADQTALVDLSARLREALSKAGTSDQNLIVAALALVAQDLLKSRDEADGQMEAVDERNG